MSEPQIEISADVQKAIQGEGIDSADDVPKDLECAVCLHPAFGGVSTPCEHVFHKSCLETALGQDKTCPSCRAGTELSGNLSFKPVGRVLSNLLGNYRVQCPQGCDAKISWEKLKNHVENDCPNTPFKCSHDGCTEGSKPRAEALCHMQECEHKQVQCQCSQWMKCKDIASHQASTCAKALVECSFCKISGIERGMLEKHLRESCNAFATISLVKPMQDEIKALSEQIKLLTTKSLTEEFQVHLPKRIRDLAVNKDGYYESSFSAYRLRIYPNGNGDYTGTHVRMFLGPSMPMNVKVSFKVGDVTETFDSEWTEKNISDLRAPKICLLNKAQCEQADVVHITVQKQSSHPTVVKLS